MFVTAVWFRFFVQSAAETCHFLQPAQVSAAILLKTMLQVSNGESGHMGKMQMTCTWSVSPWFSRITHKQPWSKTVKGVVKPRVLRWHGSVFSTWSFAWQVPQSPEVYQHLWINPWTRSNNHHSIDLFVMATILLDLRTWRFTCLFGSVEFRNQL